MLLPRGAQCDLQERQIARLVGDVALDHLQERFKRKRTDCALAGEDRDEQEALVRGRARERRPDLDINPVHYAARADIDDKCGRIGEDRLFYLRLPPASS